MRADNSSDQQSSKLRPFPHRRVELPLVAVLPGVAVLYFLAARLGLLLASAHGNVSPVWPATGFAIAACLLCGNRVWPGICLGAFAVNALTSVPPLVAGAIAAGNTLEAVFGTWLIHRFTERLARHPLSAGPIAFAGASLTAPILSATVGVASLVLTGAVPPASASQLWWTWWVGDCLGAIVLTPLLVSFRDTMDCRTPWTVKDWGRAIFVAVATSGICYIVFFHPGGTALLFAIFPTMLVAVAWFGPPGVKLTALIISVFSISAAFTGSGPFVSGNLNQDLLRLQLFLGSVATFAVALPMLRSAGGLLLPGAVLMMGWLISGWMFSSLYRERIKADEAHFNILVRDTQDSIQERMRKYIDASRGGASLFAASKSVERAEWREYAESLDLVRRYPGLNGLGVVVPVPATNVLNFLAATRADGAPDFAIGSIPGAVRPPMEPGEPAHFVITFIEPAGANRQAIGLDLASEVRRVTAARLSRDTGEPQLTDQVTLVQDGQKRPGFLLFVPMYRNHQPLATVEDRRAAHTGWIYAPLITENFFQGVLGIRSPEIDVSVFESAAFAPAGLLYASNREDRRIEKFEKTTRLHLNGRVFELGWYRSREFVATSQAPAVFAGTSSALVALLLAGLVMSLQSSSRHAREMVEARTAELRNANRQLEAEMAERQRTAAALRASEERLKAALDATSDGLWDWNIVTGEVFYSPHLLRVLGYESSEVLPHVSSWEQWLHPDDKPATMAAVQTHLDGRTARYECEHRLRRKTGEWMWNLDRGRVIERDAAGKALRMIGTHSDIGERKAAEAQVLQAKEQAEAANRELADANTQLEEAIGRANRMALAAEGASKAKSDFLAMMSHEIRTPMNGVIGFTQMLMDSLLSSEQREWVETIQGSGQTLLTLINDILDFSKIEAGKLTLESIPFAPADAARAVVALLAAQAAQKKIEFSLQLDPALPVRLLGDLNRYKQVLLNLTGNALKFTSQGGVYVRLEWRRRGDGLSVLRTSVHDTGIGITKEHQERLFQKFHQADSSTTRKFGGTGLGLAICKSLVELQGGSIALESELGQGSTFTFEVPYPRDDTPTGEASVRPVGSTLPKVDSPSVEPPLPGLLPRGGGEGGSASEAEPDEGSSPEFMPPVRVRQQVETLHGPPSAGEVEQSRCMAGEQVRKEQETLHEQVPVPGRHVPIGRENPAPIRVLLAEDIVVNQKLATSLLHKNGCVVQVAQHGREAVELAARDEYDIIFMDCQMPEMDGFEASREIRRREQETEPGRGGIRPKRIPIIAITANALQGDRELCLDAGMDDYISKPYKPSDLTRILAQWVRKSSPTVAP